LKYFKFDNIFSAVLALISTGLILSLFQGLTEKYIVREISEELLPSNDTKLYFDLNHDGNSEILSLLENSAGNFSISISNLLSETINQFNLPGKSISLGSVIDLQDINSDGITDIISCTSRNDSLFLTVITNIYRHPTSQFTVFIDSINQSNDNGDYLFSKGFVQDLNGDGSKEYIFGISGGYSLQPRRIYALDFKNDILLRSPLSGAAIIGVDQFDLNNSGTPEIVIKTAAPENHKSYIPHRDSVTWLMVLDSNLNYFYPPVEMIPSLSLLYIEPFIENENRFLLVYTKYRGAEDYNSELAIYNDSLEKVRSIKFSKKEPSPAFIWRKPGSYNLSDIYLFRRGIFYSVDDKLHITDSIKHKNTDFSISYVFQLNLDHDKLKEIVSVASSRVSIYRSDLKSPIEYDLNDDQYDQYGQNCFCSVIEEKGSYPLLAVQHGRTINVLKYSRNNWQKFWPIVYPFILIISFYLFWTIIGFQKRVLERKYKKERLINSLQLQAIKRQLEPHFTYNALNAIGALIYEEEKELAHNYLRNLTQILRQVTFDSDAKSWSLNDEIEFTKKYLELEKLRFGHTFSFEISRHDNTMDNRAVPKMSILTFVENAFKHGLMHKKDNKRLRIETFEEKEELIIIIEDNGIGRRAAAKRNSNSTGNGTKMLRDYFKLFSETTGIYVTFEYFDLENEQLHSIGTRVKVIVK